MTMQLTYRAARLRVLVLRLKATRALGWRAIRKWGLMRVLTVTCWAAERLVEPDMRRRLQERERAGS
jgi:hypothetical protein